MNKRQKIAPVWRALTLIILALFVIFVVYPLILILYRSVLDPKTNSLTMENFTRFFTRKYYTNTLKNSFKVTVVATLIAATLGLLMAYITRQVKIRGTKALNILIVVSYLLMAGSGDSDIFSTRRIVIAPMLCLSGYLLIIIGILKRSDRPKE